MSKTTVSKRKFLIGFYSSILIALLHSMNGIFQYFGVLQEAYDTTSNLIYTIAYSYFFISILFLLKEILIDYYKQEFLKDNIVWLIRLEVITAVLSVLIVLGLWQMLGLLVLILSIISFIIFILVFREILEIEKSEIPTIGYLQNYILALILFFIANMILGLIVEFGRKFELQFLEKFLVAIPFIFLGVLFYKTMHVVHK